MSNLATGLIPTIAMLLFLVGIHEWGHFFAARRFGIDVKEYSIGFGPALWSRISRKTGVEYKLCMIPLGGYVQIATEGENSMATASAPARFVIYAAGPLVNILFGFALFFVLFATSAVSFTPPLIKEVNPTGAAASAGLLAGDRIVEINDVPIYQFSDVQIMATLSPATHPDTMVVERNGERRSFTFLKKAGFFGMTSIDRLYAKTVMEAVVYSGTQIASNFNLYIHLPRLLWNLNVSPSTVLQGPVAIADVAGGIVKNTGSFIFLGYLTAMLSLGIAVTNLIPIPILDGGRMLIIVVESIVRRKLNKKVDHYISLASAGLVGLLFLAITYRDVSVYFSHNS